MNIYRVLFAAIAAVVIAFCPQAMAETVLTIQYEVSSPLGGLDCTTTLDSDGTVSTSVEWWPDPPDTSLPDCLVPDPEWARTKPKTVTLPGTFASEDAAKKQVGIEFAKHIARSWVCAIENVLEGPPTDP